MSTRIPFIAGNWKMFKTNRQAVEDARRLAELVKDVPDVDVMIAPSFTALSEVKAALAGSRILVGAQHVFWETEGAFTGAVSAPMLRSAGCDCVIMGHSERRQYFAETDETVNKRIKAVLAEGLSAVMCIGETESERESGKTYSVLDKQMRKGLNSVFTEAMNQLVIAYEPVWAIGTGRTATSEQAQEAHEFIRGTVEKLYDAETASAIRILYGGSVKPDNAAGLMDMPDIDGALVGGASLDPETFSRIVRFRG